MPGAETAAGATPARAGIASTASIAGSSASSPSPPAVLAVPASPEARAADRTRIVCLLMVESPSPFTLSIHFLRGGFVPTPLAGPHGISGPAGKPPPRRLARPGRGRSGDGGNRRSPHAGWGAAGSAGRGG